MENWLISEDRFIPEHLRKNETLFTTGNGYLCTRGTFEEGYPAEQAVTLIHGVFDDAPIVSTELANTPNWIDLRVYAGSELLRLDRAAINDYGRQLDLHDGMLRRSFTWAPAAGGSLRLAFERFASLADEHILGVRLSVESIDYAGPLEFRAGLPGYIDNDGLLHWEWQAQGSADSGASLCLKTRHSATVLCEAFHLTVTGGQAVMQHWDTRWSPEVVARLEIEPNQRVTVDKLAIVYTSRDTPEPAAEARRALQAARAAGFDRLAEANRAAWANDWQSVNVTIEGDDSSDLAVRYGLFQLLAVAPRNDQRVSIPAKALSGYGYRGHVFWDTEIFMLPFFTYTRPDIARNLLMYRYYTLAGARRKAAGQGREGACFAWESAASGDEMTPRWVTGPDGELVRIWCGDIELHISADVAYAIYQFWRVTGDDDFLRDYGAEILLDTARYWGSRAEWRPGPGRYEINDVIGPDENHDHINNNAYTNNMAVWNLRTALEVLTWLRAHAPHQARELEQNLDLSAERLAHWQDVITRMKTGYNPDTHLFEQFDGFFQLREVDLPALEPRSQSVQSLLGITGAQQVQVIKQPDVLMLLNLLPDAANPQALPANWDYYTPRTDLTHGSSLGPAVQAILAARLGKIDQAYRHFHLAAQTDLQDARKNLEYGLHPATQGGLWQAVVFGFAGLSLAGGQPTVSPRLPPGWSRLKFTIRYHGQPYEFDLSPPPVQQPALPIRGAIFDLDGVLTDTSEMHYRAWKQLADEENMPFDRQDNEALRGVSRRESLLRLLKGKTYSEDQLQALMERKNRYYQELIEALSPQDLLPGVREFLQDLRRAGVRIAVGSSSKNSRGVIERLAIGSLLDEIADGASVEQAKPAPDLFLFAARQLGVSPQHCVVFEDAQAGVEAGLSAQMWVVGIGPRQRVGAAHQIFSGLNQIRWEDLLAQLRTQLTKPTGEPDQATHPQERR